jgi:hypothetical protein
MKMFRVTPRFKSAKVKAKILEAVLNRPDVADRIIDALAEILKDRAKDIITGEVQYPPKDFYGQGIINENSEPF